ncbi:DUF3775 domain-containing protein [Rhodobacter capsulatus]|uniref:DUF3775 domain-containing protein n=1 Tax=Rhodobacter capsulatus TaxID=1061 RepID=UPI004027924F
MLPISPSKIAHVIINARKFDAEVPGSGQARELRAFIAALNEDEQAALTALMWIGRETFEPEEFDEAFETAKAEATAPTEDYLLGIPMLADYLEDGLNAMGISLEEAEDEIHPDGIRGGAAPVRKRTPPGVFCQEKALPFLGKIRHGGAGV